ncbi:MULTISPECIES: hypothetical protein [Pseudomonas]|uniref:hypothetical protein n=1 Tax=Pseudomonas TaxID=286 RepID=UPI001574B303|nr:MULTISPECIES: hypothetical protein [Pseudomonas]MBG6127615.1 membrane protease YdiL (CAAX protease family) [Pseudomonas sp. M2]NSX20725.1 hypothetical protein [Pseudomonas putida]HDS1744699.1 hypothetical protein [Pseudomonas putida]
MNMQTRAKLSAWAKRPRGSLGWIAAIATLVVAASIYQVLGPAWQLPMRAPAIVLALLALSAAVGLAVHRSFKSTVGKTIFSGQGRGWQARLAIVRDVARESNILLGMLLLLAVLGLGSLILASRSVQGIVSECETNLQAQVDLPEDQALAALVAQPVCQCLAQTFLERNGVIRLALFNTPLLEVSAFKGVTEADERRCLEQLDLLPEATAGAPPQASESR